MRTVEQLREWAQIAGLPPRSVREKGDLSGLFQGLAGQADKLKTIFDGHYLGEEVFQRVTECLAVTSRNASAAYLAPRSNGCSAQKSETLLRAHFQDLCAIAQLMNDMELVEVLSTVRFQEVTEPEVNDSCQHPDSPDVWIYDMITNYSTTLREADTPIALLSEAAYSIANDLILREFIMWPTVRHSATLDDPFRSYFQVWANGINYSVQSADRCVFCA